MAGPSGGPKRQRPQGPSKGKPGYKRRRTSLQDDMEEIALIEATIAAGAPPPGSNPLAMDPSQAANGGLPGGSVSSVSIGSAKRSKQGEGHPEHKPYAGVKLFADLPISDRTKRGLKEGKFVTMTAIQRAALPHILCGRDVLGAAKTGSGKTLAFVLPIVEKLYRQRWGPMDGVGAIVISPTRELATQIFNELKKVGKHHGLSGGLLIGGQKDVQAEKDRVSALNILVCTPGRLLQHMDETPNFDCSQLQMLVLDEADRILDLGFSQTLNAIIANLPKTRQTLLFSATQTKSVKDLARLSLRSPEYLAVHAESKVATPSRLQQTVMLVPLEQKLDMLWSFLKTHLQAKTLVFLSSCKQTQFVYEAVKRLRPGVPLKCLHGRMKQMRRLAVYYEFTEARHAVLFATDVAARGLDFPTVDWVVQMDCPEDVASYIHRVGRTARFNASGRSLLFVMPSEKAMLPALEAAKIPFKLTKANPQKVQQLAPALAGLLSREPELKHMAQRAFVTYLRSIHLQSNKAIFDVSQLPHAAFATSLGLPTTPRIRFLKKGQKKLAEEAAVKKLAEGKVEGGDEEGDGEEEEEDEGDSVGEEDEEWQGEEGGGHEEEDEGEEGEGEEDGVEGHRKEGNGHMGAGRLDGKQGHKRQAGEGRSGHRAGKEGTGAGDHGDEEEEGEGGEGESEGMGEEENNGEKAEGTGQRKRTKVGEDSWRKLMAIDEAVKAMEDADEAAANGVAGANGGAEKTTQKRVSPATTRVAEGRAERDDEGGEQTKAETTKKKKSKIERLFAKKNVDVLSEAYEKLRAKTDEGEEEGGGRKRKAGGRMADGEEEEDEFLRMKRVDHRLEGEVEETLPPVGSVVLGKRKKKKLKIDPGRAGGSRLVFDDEGNALKPLEALAAAAKGDGASLPDTPAAVRAAAAERFRKLQLEMRARDKEDRLAEKQRLREKRLKLKQKVKKRSGDGEREGTEQGVQLSKLSEEGDEEEDSDKGGFGRRMGRLPGDGNSSDDETGPRGGSKFDSGSEDEGSRGGSGSGSRRREAGSRGRGKGAHARTNMALADQEALALKLLEARRKT